MALEFPVQKRVTQVIVSSSESEKEVPTKEKSQMSTPEVSKSKDAILIKEETPSVTTPERNGPEVDNNVRTLALYSPGLSKSLLDLGFGSNHLLLN